MIKRELYLAHHGRKGQRWGVKNGPPYPLTLKRQKDYKRAVRVKKAAAVGLAVSLSAGARVPQTIMEAIKNSDHKFMKTLIDIGKGYYEIAGPLGVAGIVISSATMIGANYVKKKIEEEQEALAARLNEIKAQNSARRVVGTKWNTYI